MAHKDSATSQYRLYLRPDTVKQLKLLTLILGRDDWNLVADDMIRLGIAYMNETGKLELADWKNSISLMDLRQNLGLRVIRGELPLPEAS